MATSRRRSRRQRVVITGISGRLGRVLARRLHKTCEVIGIDRRGGRHLPRGVTVHAIDIRRKACEDIFRRTRIDAVIHLNVLHDPRKTDEEHHRFNIVGTHKLLDYCVRRNVSKFILLSSANVYGASPDNQQFLNEEAPLLAATHFTAMRDLVEIDMYTSSFFWRHPEMDTVILRPVHIVGHVSNAASNYLRLKRPPYLMGFDPMVQLIHVDDVVEAIARSVRPGVRGVFNVTGPGEVALSVLQRQLGRAKIPVPGVVAKPLHKAMWKLRMTSFPPEEMDFIKYICMVDGSRVREAIGFEPRKTLRETIEAVRY